MNKLIAISLFCLFGIDESVRKGQKGTAYIINLKVSDKTDSFLVKFVRFKEEEYNQILKPASWLSRQEEQFVCLAHHLCHHQGR